MTITYKRLLIVFLITVYIYTYYNFLQNYSNKVSFHDIRVTLESGKINCSNIVNGNMTEIMKTYEYMHNYSYYNILPDTYFRHLSENCSNLKIFMKLDIRISPEEADFPLAFIILLYKDVEQMIRLLGAIYRPHNWYCIHADRSASVDVHVAVRAIANCFDNVFAVTRTEDVIYGHVSRLRAEINCMRDLLQSKRKWRYVFNTPSQQYPLKTNAEIVKILRKYNSSNIIEGIQNQKSKVKVRYAYHYIVKHNNVIRKSKKIPFSYGHKPITIVKGSALGCFSRSFVEYTLNSELAAYLLQWMSDIYSPDEYYWATLNYNEAIPAPGRYINGNSTMNDFLVVFVDWEGSNQCRGKYIREICIFGIEDVQYLVRQPQMFANKFLLDYQPLALSCMEDWYHKKRNVEFTTNEKQSSLT